MYCATSSFSYVLPLPCSSSVVHSALSVHALGSSATSLAPHWNVRPAPSGSGSGLGIDPRAAFTVVESTALSLPFSALTRPVTRANDHADCALGVTSLRYVFITAL